MSKVSSMKNSYLLDIYTRGCSEESEFLVIRWISLSGSVKKSSNMRRCRRAYRAPRIHDRHDACLVSTAREAESRDVAAFQEGVRKYDSKRNHNGTQPCYPFSSNQLFGRSTARFSILVPLAVPITSVRRSTARLSILLLTPALLHLVRRRAALSASELT